MLAFDNCLSLRVTSLAEGKKAYLGQLSRGGDNDLPSLQDLAPQGIFTVERCDAKALGFCLSSCRSSCRSLRAGTCCSNVVQAAIAQSNP